VPAEAWTWRAIKHRAEFTRGSDVDRIPQRDACLANTRG
jgi:hypothetical protein